MLNSAKLGNTFFSTYVQQVTFEKRKLMFYGTPSHIFFTIIFFVLLTYLKNFYFLKQIRIKFY